MPFRARIGVGFILILTTAPVQACAWDQGEERTATEVTVAVAANVATAQEALTRRFTETTGIPVRTSVGSTGQLYAQILGGAPFQVFLSADQERPRLLEEGGRAVEGSRFTYAAGRMALYAPGNAPLPDPPWSLLRRAGTRIAVADPKTAPYGTAARATLARLGLLDAVGDRLVVGENVGQTFRFVDSGAAEVGFVALSQVMERAPGTYRVIPDSLHPPLRQDAVLLRAGADSPQARAFLDYLRGPEAATILRRFGYRAPVPDRAVSTP